MLSLIFNLPLHQKILSLAIPMALSTISIPLLGLVDLAVIGHLEHAWYLGGVTIGSTIINLVFWLFGFLRMSTTGLVAQAYGRDDKNQIAALFIQGLVSAFLLATLILVVHPYIIYFSLNWSDASVQSQYFNIRIWATPAALMNLVIIGWFIGMQNAKAPMIFIIITNVINICLDLLFVIVLQWQVIGVGLASVLANYTSLIVSVYYICRNWKKLHLPQLQFTIFTKLTANLTTIFSLNRDIFIRSLCLQAVFTFMTFQGANFGDDIVAANAVLMSLVMLISYAMDGFAYAIEAMVGKAIGAKDKKLLKQALQGTFLWGLLICLMLTLAFYLYASNLIQLITSIDNIQNIAHIYLPWIIAMPLISIWGFLLDGVFIGATKGKDMRNIMFLAMCSFFIVFITFSSFANHALWLAMLSFMAIRGLGLGILLQKHWQHNSI